MNNEFKKIKTDTETRYVLESMTAGGTGASNVASVPGTVGNVQRRSDNILAQEADKKKKIPPSTPRNFVAKNAKTSGAGAHTDKRKEIPRKEKHKKPTFEDHEVQMASSELQTAAKEAVQILKMIQQYGEGQGLEAWQQSKITKAADYLHSVVQSISGRQRVAEGAVKKLDSDIKDKTISDTAFKVKHGMSRADAKKQLTPPKPNTKPVSEDAGKVCQQCGMKDCTCAPGKCKCTPKPGYPKKQKIAELKDETKKSYKEKAQQQVADLKPHAKKGEYKDIAKRAIQRREKGLARVKDVAEITVNELRQTAEIADINEKIMHLNRLFVDAKKDGDVLMMKKIKERLYQLAAKKMAMNQGVAEGAKVDRQAAHITKSMMKKGKSKKDAESIAWAHIKHPKKAKESKDTYMESLINRLNKQLT